MWDTLDGSLLKKFEGHNDLIRSLQVTADTETLISSSDDKLIKIWNIKEGKLNFELKDQI